MFHWIISLQNTMKLYLSTVFSNLNLIKKQIVNSGRIELIKLQLEIKLCFFSRLMIKFYNVFLLIKHSCNRHLPLKNMLDFFSFIYPKAVKLISPFKQN